MFEALVGLVKDDWQTLALNHRFALYCGISLILAAWLGDNWSDQQQYHVPLPLTQNNEQVFQVGCVLIGISLFLLFVQNLYLFGKIQWLRLKYPLRNKGEAFHLVNFNGWLYLFHHKTHKRFHIKNQLTAFDLGFLYEWDYIDQNLSDLLKVESSAVKLPDGKEIVLHEYKENTRGIRTRGVTAT